MTVPSPALFPGGRILSGWWRQLAALQPRALWVGQFVLHRIDALTRVIQRSPLDSFTQLLLRALDLEPESSTSRLEGRLHLGAQVVRQLLRGLERIGLARSLPPDAWTLTDLGRGALEQGAFPRPVEERRTFSFVEPENPSPPPHFLNVGPAAGVPCPPGEEGRFARELLDECLRRPAEWKQRHGFPTDVEEVLDVSTPLPENTPPLEMWQRVVVDRPERFPAALVLTGGPADGERLQGFAVRPEGWLLQASKPAFELDGDWAEVFPDLVRDPAADVWRPAWRAWCQPRGLPASEVEACSVELHDCRLRVLAPPRLVDRLRAARSDVFKGEAWVLAGTGRLRQAAVLELVEAKPSAPRT
jgi:hypothetical protein